MELVFQEKQLDYLGRVLDQTVTQELTAEVIVPDSCADADRVVDAFGTLLVRAEECTAGTVSLDSSSRRTFSPRFMALSWDMAFASD